tara:strand:- start:192 stop:764 length:573 start_codon:yes stop_codon:yes gene_type:complete
MIIKRCSLSEVLLIKPEKIMDQRGWFMENFRKNLLEEKVGHPLYFCQENITQSYFGVIRGLHYQMPPNAQSKLVSVINGRVLDVILDIRKGSPSFGNYIAIELSSENQKQLFIPRGFAHGFSCLSKTAILAYKVDSYYNKNSEASIAFDDPQLAIDWKVPLEKQILSSKDREHSTFEAAKYFDYNQSLYD